VRRPRLEDVAAEVGVSPASVSLVLRGIRGPSAATRERVLEAAARLGYRPDRAASLLASRRSGLIGVVMEISNAFHAELVEEVQEAADRHGYNLVLSPITRSRNEARAVETLLDSGVKRWFCSVPHRLPRVSPPWIGSFRWWSSVGRFRPQVSTWSGLLTMRALLRRWSI